jgi:predicted GNAT family N-acyltransferase
MTDKSGTVRQQYVECSGEAIEVYVTTSASDKYQIYRLRYQVYIEELGRKIASADDENGLLYDGLDESSNLVCAKIGSEVVGSVRVNIGKAKDFSLDLVSTLLMNKFQEFHKGQHNLCFASKYVVSPAYRKTQVGHLLLEYLDNFCRKHQVQFNLAGCNPYLITFYEKVGYRRFTNQFTVPEYGCMVPLVWIIEDARHLYEVRSPYFDNACKGNNNSAAADWFRRAFPQAAHFVNSRLVSEDALWAILREKVGCSPMQAIPVLDGLSEKEAKNFVNIGVIHACKKGDRIISVGDRCYEMNILLKGRLEVNTIGAGGLSVKDTITVGQLFGKVALFAIEEQVVNIIAVTAGEYLIIPGTVFEKYRHNHSVIADKIMQNMNQNRMLQLTNSVLQHEEEK